jgi:hypothetical protein
MLDRRIKERNVIMLKDIQLEMFKKLVPYLRGALWWAKND